MVAAPFKRNQKIKKEMKRKPKNKNFHQTLSATKKTRVFYLKLFQT